MAVSPVAAEDDPRLQSNCYPCYGKHLEGKVRNNQYATWQSCCRCGLRLMYTKKSAGHGNDRQVGPIPSAVMLAIAELQLEVPAEQCTEKIFNGKLLELQGKRLQSGQANTMAINQKLEEYKQRMEGPRAKSVAYPKAVTPAIQDTSMIAESQRLQEAAVEAQQMAEKMAKESQQNAMHLAAENELLKKQVEEAKIAATEAMRRTELLAKESLEQKNQLNAQLAAQEQSKMTAAKSSPSTPKSGPPVSKAASPASVFSINSTEDEKDPKKRALGEASSVSGEGSKH